MLCRRVSLEELHPALGGGAPETGLDIYLSLIHISEPTRPY
mgnify:CR=1 FL=1